MIVVLNCFEAQAMPQENCMYVQLSDMARSSLMVKGCKIYTCSALKAFEQEGVLIM
jgi:hypothetical protein